MNILHIQPIGPRRPTASRIASSLRTMWPAASAVGLLALACLGCQGTGQTSQDPFFPRTRVSPPMTSGVSGGAMPPSGVAPTGVSPQGSDPYYRQGTAIDGETTRVASANATAAQTTIKRNHETAREPAARSTQFAAASVVRIPEASYEGLDSDDPKPTARTYRGPIAASPQPDTGSVVDATAKPLAGQTAALTDSQSAERYAAELIASRRKVVRDLAPLRPRREAATTDGSRRSEAERTPRLLPHADASLVDVHDLPTTENQAGSATSRQRPGRIDPQVQPASAQAITWVDPTRARNVSPPPAAPSTTPSAGVRSATAYGFSADYGRLRGRLEYSKARDEWKLRYIPIDGATDEHGGSVVLDTDGVDFRSRPGEFVEVHGRLVDQPTDADDASFAPHFQPRSIKPLD